MNVLLRTLPAAPVDDPVLAAQLAAWSATDPGVAQRAVTAWTRLHGLVSLEIAGNFASMGLDADRLFAREVLALQ
jgi:Tetracyclin repressor-like, C-terminal domain